jgi:hypothetical protein
MAIPGDVRDRETRKFVESPSRPGQTAVEVVGDITANPGPFSPPANCDYILRSVSSNVETYVYKNGGSGGTTLKTVTVTYVDSTLESLVSVEVV